MAFSLDTVQEDILAFLRSQFEPQQKVYDDYIPNTTTIRRNSSGEIEPYLVVQFGDIQTQNSYSFAGPFGDDYGMPVYIQAISADPKIARALGNKVTRTFLGSDFPWTGSVRKRPGFNMFTIDSSDMSVEAYASPCFFTVLVQLTEEA